MEEESTGRLAKSRSIRVKCEKPQVSLRFLAVREGDLIRLKPPRSEASFYCLSVNRRAVAHRYTPLRTGICPDDRAQTCTYLVEVSDMAWIETRKRSGGGVSAYVAWRLGGGSGDRQTETFSAASDEQNVARAEGFKKMVEAAGERWPDGWVKGEGFLRPGGGDPLAEPATFPVIGEEYVRQIVDITPGQRKSTCRRSARWRGPRSAGRPRSSGRWPRSGNRTSRRG